MAIHYFASILRQHQLDIAPELLKQVAKGDQMAFRSLFDQLTPLLLVFVERLVKSKADAEEIVQEVMTKVWLNRAELPGIAYPGQYIYTMARNRALDQLRKITRDEQLLQAVWAYMSADVDNSLEEKLRTEEVQELVQQSLRQLPEQKQTVYRLSREEGLSQAEIAERMGISKSRVNNLLVETLKVVKNHLEQHSELLAILFWISCWKNLF